MIFVVVFLVSNFSFAECVEPNESSLNTCKSNCNTNIMCVGNCQATYQDQIDQYEQCLFEEEQAANEAATKCTCTKDWNWNISNVTCAAWDTRSTNTNACECVHDKQTVMCEDITSTTSSCSEQENDRIPRWENNSCPSWYEQIADGCCGPIATETATPAPTKCTPVMGITCCEEELINGQCKLNIYDTLGIRQSVRDKDDPTSVGLFVQDVVLSATFFIGTLVTIALIVSGLMFIFAASSGKSPEKAKQWIMWSLIGLLIVVSSYVIIRLVQYIAKGF